MNMLFKPFSACYTVADKFKHQLFFRQRQKKFFKICFFNKFGTVFAVPGKTVFKKVVIADIKTVHAQAVHKVPCHSLGIFKKANVHALRAATFNGAAFFSACSTGCSFKQTQPAFPFFGGIADNLNTVYPHAYIRTVAFIIAFHIRPQLRTAKKTVKAACRPKQYQRIQPLLSVCAAAGSSPHI